MNKLSTIVVSTLMAGAANAGIPLLNSSCPGDIEVHADAGGPVYINGKQAELKTFNENYYEAKGAGVTVSISINPDGSPSVSYTGKHKAHGICQVADSGQAGGDSAKPDLGPMKYDASGTMACSAGEPTYDQRCGWRVVRKAGGDASIWISNIAVKEKPAYRVLKQDICRRLQPHTNLLTRRSRN